jgi:S-adenosylmethionine:tRNA ribosyltransferase-isomerase
VSDDLVSAYSFDLPEELIAQEPAEQRDASRLMVVDGDRIEHRVFRELPQVMRPGDLLVLNQTRVIAARIFGTRAPGRARAELLLLHPAGSLRYDPRADTWVALTRPARRLRVGQRIEFGHFGGATVVRELDEGMREIRFALNVEFEQFLSEAGRMPLPPYIHNDSPEAQERYQTIFARIPGSVAAPTASLHFTQAVLDELQARGIELVYLTLDVGLGTFRPMSSERIDEHVMHAERYAISEEAASAIVRAQERGRRIVAAGTTVVRALEGNAALHGRITPGEGVTEIFIRPGFAFRVVDAMITNFHLPRSTLLVLVSAFAGRERILRAYAQAVASRYRFFSFGDAMFLTRQTPQRAQDRPSPLISQHRCGERRR